MPHFSAMLDKHEKVVENVDYEKMFNVFQGKYTKHVYERHAAIVSKLCIVYKKGFPLKELGFIVKLIELCLDKIDEGGNEIFPALMEVIHVCR